MRYKRAEIRKIGRKKRFNGKVKKRGVQIFEPLVKNYFTSNNESGRFVLISIDEVIRSRAP